MIAGQRKVFVQVIKVDKLKYAGICTNLLRNELKLYVCNVFFLQYWMSYYIKIYRWSLYFSIESGKSQYFYRSFKLLRSLWFSWFFFKIKNKTKIIYACDIRVCNRELPLLVVQNNNKRYFNFSLPILLAYFYLRTVVLIHSY